MSIVLAATWDPRGELARLERLMPLLRELYAALAIVVPGEADETITSRLTARGFRVLRAEPWARGRYMALEARSRSRRRTSITLTSTA